MSLVVTKDQEILADTVAGGSSQVLRNIIAERLPGLHRDGEAP